MWAILHLWLWGDFCTYLAGSPEPYYHQFFGSELSNDAVVFDVGAYIGAYTLEAGSRVTHGRVHSFEPDPRSFARLKWAVERNHLSQVVLSNKAVADQEGSMEFNLHAYLPQSHLVRRDAPGTGYSRVPVVSLDRYCHAAGINRLDVCKIDVEGAELLVLRGARETLAAYRPVLFIEIHKPFLPRYGHSPQDLVSFLQEAGYQLFEVRRGILTRELERIDAGYILGSREPILRIVAFHRH